MKKIHLILTCCILIFLFIVIRIYCVGNFLQLDDVDSVQAGFHNIFYSQWHNVLNAFIDILLGWYIPSKISVHPSFYKSYYFSYIEAFVFLFFIFIYTLILYRKKDGLFPVAILTGFGIFMYSFSWNIYFNAFVYDTFSRFVLASLYWTLLFFFLTLDNYKSKKMYIIPICLFTLLSSISNELICITTFVGLFVYGFIQSKNNHNQNIFKYSMIAFCGLVFLVLSGMFTRRTDLNTLDIQYFINVIQLIPEYVVSYVKYIFINHFLEYILIAIQIYLIYKKNIATDINKNVIKLSLCFISAYLLFMFLLVALGKTGFDDAKLWVGHRDLHFCISVINCVCNIALFNILLKFNILKKQFVYIIFILIPLISVLLLRNIYIDKKNILNEQAIKTYKAEKIIRIANEQNKIAYLNEALLSDGRSWHLAPSFDGEKDTIYNDIPYISLLNIFEKGKKIDCKVIYTDLKTAEAEFEKNGGTFTDEELKEHNFNNLLDKDFMQNKTK